MSDRPKTSSADEWALWLDEWKGANTAFLAVQIAEAIEEQRADLLPVVKPLVWEDYPVDGGPVMSKAIAMHGTYFIVDDTDDFSGLYLQLISHDNAQWWQHVRSTCDTLLEGIHGDDLEPIKAAAQADHEARIRACLDMIDPAALVAGAYEAAASKLAKAAQAEAEINNPHDAELLWHMEKRIRALTPADAQAALDAVIAKAVNKKLEEVAKAARTRRIPTLQKEGRNGYALARAEIAAAILAMKETE